MDPKTGQRQVRNEPEYIRQAIDKSLSRLGLPYVDLYYCHRIDNSRPIEETVAVMKEIKEAGKCKYLGLSECSAETLRRAYKVVHIDAVQIEYSPFTMDIESPQINLLSIAYSPLGRGFLTGSLRSPDDLEQGDFRKNAPRFSPENFHKNLELVDTPKMIADKKRCTAGQLTLAFLMAQGEDIIPIPGTTRTKNFDENMGSLKVELSNQENKTIRSAIEKAEVKGGRYPEAMAKALFADTVPLKA